MESEVVDMMLAATSTELARDLRSQLQAIESASVSDTGVGLVKRFKLGDNVLPIPTRGSFALSNVGAEINSGESYLTFMLFVKDGLLDILESTPVTDEWPKHIEQYRLSYINAVT